MIWLLVFLSGGIGTLIYGIWEQKTVYRNPHFTEGEVIGHRNVRSSNLAVAAMNAVAGIVVPIIGIDLPDGTKLQVRLHNQIARSALSKYPELDLGGRVTVTYFGDHPREAFLAGHPLAQTPMRVSPVLLISIVFWFIAIGLTVLYFCIR